MNLEPVIQREASQKEKNKYINTHTQAHKSRKTIDESICREGMEMQIQRKVSWTQ